MASIFSFDSDPPRVSSPWLTPTETPKSSTPQPRDGTTTSSGVFAGPAHLQDYGVTRLEAEPQEGPTEYKLHLLLRPRKTYDYSSTRSLMVGSQQNKQPQSNQAPNDMPTLAASNQSRQHRLVQLTTQLLWRLQQSSPYHASSTSDLVVPKLPEAAESLDTPSRAGKLLAGLEDSRGALYEIGVSDDGTFVGLTKDEMDESLTNLGSMAASLGCKVEVVRMVVVGDCEWHEAVEPRLSVSQPAQRRSKSAKFPLLQDDSRRHQEQLWVAEALVTPDLSSSRISMQAGELNSPFRHEILARTRKTNTPEKVVLGAHQSTEQLRITLTGPTTSGKSSLLGTLSTATLDNGRGKSRLSLLKHRHEIASGMTSSVAQELIGYKDQEVFNFTSGNVTSWTDIHAAAENGRLVFVSDSAGHPRYRRTTVRGLVGWAPHCR